MTVKHNSNAIRVNRIDLSLNFIKVIVMVINRIVVINIKEYIKTVFNINMASSKNIVIISVNNTADVIKVLNINVKY